MYPLNEFQTCSCGEPFLAQCEAQYRCRKCSKCFDELRPSDPEATDTTPKVKKAA